MATGTSDRFSGFADLYDRNRPSAPDALAPLLCAYAGVAEPDVVDLGSGTGLSSRWAARWAGSVIGIEPNADMREQAAARGSHGRAPVVYRDGTAEETGLPRASADIVMAVQAMHWMEPVATLAEVVRLLRPGGVFVALDADWPPVSGVAGAEQAWAGVHARMTVFEARLARGESGDVLRRPVEADDPTFANDDLVDPHRDRAMPDGLQSWSKREHLANIRRSGHFSSARELLFQQTAPIPEGTVDGGSGVAAEHFIAIMRSQGSYQGLLRRGLTAEDLGVERFERHVRTSFAAAPVRADSLSFNWRARIGIRMR